MEGEKRLFKPVDTTSAVNSTVEQMGFEIKQMGFETRPVVPLYGLPGPLFTILHSSAIVSLSISIIFSAVVLLRLLCPCRCDIWKRKIGERLVIYLAVCDLGFSVTHVLDHVVLQIRHDYAPLGICASFGFVVVEFVLAQALVVTYTAFSAFIMVVREKSINLGRCDWRLIVTSLGIPSILCTIVASYGYFGPGGAW